MTGSLESSYWLDIKARSDAEGVAQVGERLSDRFGRLDPPVRIQSLGSGCCAHEINLSRNLRCNHVFTCPDINARMPCRLLAQARKTCGGKVLPVSRKVVPRVLSLDRWLLNQRASSEALILLQSCQAL